MVREYLISIPQLITSISIPQLITSIFIPHPSPGMPLLKTQRAFLPKPIIHTFEQQARPRQPGPPPRLSFGHGSELNGYPSTGGFWILTNPHPVLLQHLSIDRFTAIPSERDSDKVAEDAFCDLLKKVGATWWRSFYAAEIETDAYPNRPKPDRVFLGWPKNGGVWFLQLKDSEFLKS